jgi:TrmH family RNA methyltransferase
MKTITSPENPLIKMIGRLKQPSRHRSRDRFILEGSKLVTEALAGSIEIERIIVSKGFLRSETGRALLSEFREVFSGSVAVPDRLYRRLSNLENPEGILLVARTPSRPLTSLSGDLLLVVAGVQDPGNLGTMARVAEAACASALVRCRGSADPFQPKALRASMGSLIRLPVFEAGTPEATLPILKGKGLRLAACLPRGGSDYREVDLRDPLALVVGNESSGLPVNLLKLCDRKVSVPMRESVESLNVAFVAGLLLYEAARQRGTL